MPIINMGINPASKNKKRKINKSKEQKTPNINVSINKRDIKNSLILNLTLLIVEIIQIGTIKVVKRIKTKLIPSIPTL